MHIADLHSTGAMHESTLIGNLEKWPDALTIAQHMHKLVFLRFDTDEQYFIANSH